MPLYTCISDSRTTSAQRGAVALAITASHCEHTGAPPEFVHVVFSDYLGGAEGSRLRIVGNIRTGRPAALKTRMADDIVAKVSALLSVSRHHIRLVLQEVRPEWAMEGGAVLPEPGTEEAWLKEHWAGHDDEARQDGEPDAERADASLVRPQS